MAILVQKHRAHPVWKLYDEKKAYLGQILGDVKENMPTLAQKISELLLGAEDENYTKVSLADGSLNIIDKSTGKRVAGLEKDFTLLGEAIQANL